MRILFSQFSHQRSSTFLKTSHLNNYHIFHHLHLFSIIIHENYINSSYLTNTIDRPCIIVSSVSCLGVLYRRNNTIRYVQELLINKESRTNLNYRRKLLQNYFYFLSYICSDIQFFFLYQTFYNSTW